MQAFRLVPKIFRYDTFEKFNEEFKIGKRDLLVTNEWLFTPYIKPLGLDTNILFQEKYGSGEPSDEMINAMAKDMKKMDFDRICSFALESEADICLFGHSHMPTAFSHNKILMFNPGSISRSNNLSTPTYGIIDIFDDGKVDYSLFGIFDKTHRVLNGDEYCG